MFGLLFFLFFFDGSFLNFSLTPLLVCSTQKYFRVKLLGSCPYCGLTINISSVMKKDAQGKEFVVYWGFLGLFGFVVQKCHRCGAVGPLHAILCVHNTKQQVLTSSVEVTELLNRRKCLVGTTSALH